MKKNSNDSSSIPEILHIEDSNDGEIIYGDEEEDQNLIHQISPVESSTTSSNEESEGFNVNTLKPSQIQISNTQSGQKRRHQPQESSCCLLI